ncbi:biotin-dependent carboxyltransferase family protein [Sinobaca sp. H24]|uniref:5-oxoprolinase subunit C family protein n=1 Tax=Sinobaca sp. H24 TaxID=2923376 RepID=UPI002079F5BE|nr:biotin-dependent carboxyltransferase family protein [Sinobaca sp. H24]
MPDILCKVEKPGLLTTIQDLGRYGYQDRGVAPAGAMDVYSLMIGNLLVGNEENTPGLEITIMGPKLVFEAEAVIALTGADLHAACNGKPVPQWKSFLVHKGDVLSFKGHKNGSRAYLTVEGGFDGERFLESSSTYLKAKIGGIEGRALFKNDMLYYHADRANGRTGKGISRKRQPVYLDEQVLRVIEGPDTEAFTPESVELFYRQGYTVTKDADRMGCRLEGETLSHVDSADILSEASSFGTIQVPAGGQPIILMADRQTTGGYTRIATVISADLPKAAQLYPGQRVRFKKVSLENANQVKKKKTSFIKSIKFASNYQ